MRLDIGWRDFLAAAVYCVLPGGRSETLSRVEEAWSSREDFLITLSVRSAFDLALRALQFPSGSEILLSALTVSDMVRIVRSHGLVPVPVDTDEHGNVCTTSLRRSLSAASRMLVVAHLFGGRAPLDEVVDVVRAHQLVVVEDCAQSFRRVGDSGHPASDIVMHSFGPIKTATAVGGGVVRVASEGLRQRMAGILASDPVQSRFGFARHIARFAAVKALSGRCASTLFRRCVRLLGFDFDSLANSLGRGFASADLLDQIRRRPCTALLRLLRRRWQSYDFTRIDRRVRLGRRLDEAIGRQHAPAHTYWVYPLFVSDPTVVRDRLCSAGYDATCRSRMIVVPAIDDARIPASAEGRWNHVLFLPLYPEMAEEAVDQMAELVRCAEVKTSPLPRWPNRRPVGTGE